MLTIDQIKQLRDETGSAPTQIKKALEESNGDTEKARELLRIWGKNVSIKKVSRETKSGLIEAYVHDGKIGVLVEVLTETDFVARNSDFKEFVHSLGLQIAATNPKYISKDNIPAEVLEKEKDDLIDQIKDSGKPEEIVKKIVEGKIGSYYAEVCLLEQPYIKDQDKTINDLLTDLVSKVGEKIVISRFVRYELGS